MEWPSNASPALRNPTFATPSKVVLTTMLRPRNASSCHCLLRLVATLLCAVSCHRTIAADSVTYHGAAEPTTAEEIYGQGVRETPWLSPEDEQQGFHLPPGFSIELFASEPQIAKPMNLAWDARGRMWVTSSKEYPYPAAEGAPAGDTIQILEDIDGDGRADKSTTFADGLNIPIGILPVKDGVICYSIPNLWLLRDTDGDDHVDERVLLLGPFDTTRDTHGMVNSLTNGHDGWVYACHGFNNQSLVAASDGSRVQLISGNTFRFRADGSRIEQFTSGQVNPFGITRDEWGNWYSADCHSKPLTRLIRGACYPSFGRPDDGLGFAPAMMEHLHGSTAICGLLYYQAEQFPPAFRHLLYSGNVMTSRINCDAIEWQGATPTANELPDFLTSDDPWFRPNDIQLGCDGAMYVSDFYNRIIGHYEVPLEHPGRDRNSGRIWRISYGNFSAAVSGVAEPPTSLAIDHGNLTDELASSNEARRSLAVELALTDKMQLGSDAAESLLNDATQSERLRISCLEVLLQRGQLHFSAELLDEASTPPHLLVRQLALAAELPLDQRRAAAELVRDILPFANAQANLVAVQLLGSVVNARDIQQLAGIIGVATSSTHDAALIYTARIAIRDILRDETQLALASKHWSDLAPRPANNDQTAVDQLIAETLLAVPTSLAAARLLDYVAAHPHGDAKFVDAAMAAAAKHADADLLERLLAVLKQVKPDSLLEQTQQFERVCEVYLGGHTELSPPLRSFGLQLQNELADQLNATTPSMSWSDATGSDWASESRMSSGDSDAMLRSSFTRGEKYTGQLISEPFACPEQLQFFLAGHNGIPDQADPQRNYIALQSVATGEQLRQAFPPRNDTAQRIQWSLADVAGQSVRLVLNDGDDGSSYAWLAAGQFSLGALDPGDSAAKRAAYLALVKRGLQAVDAAKIDSLPLSPYQRSELIVAALKGTGQTTEATLAVQALKLGRSDLVTTQLVSKDPQVDLLEWSKPLTASATLSQQREMAGELLRSAEGCTLLRKLLENGLLSPLSMRLNEALLPAAVSAETKQYLQDQIELARQLPDTQLTSTDRISKLNSDTADRELGQKLQQQHCAACHQLRGQGTLIGPQLDGAIVRGPQRLAEDILEPNTNVDKAFRISALLLDDDTVLTGLVREVEDGSLMVTGQDGKVQQLPAARVVERRDSGQSLMPANFGELLDDHQLASLLKFLTNP
ncbi:MAG: PVC-type heme-binding CxxCH protein [Aureliella sp.]